MRIAFVVQRYGPEINGGAELECRLLAERLARHAEVEVLTTCAEDVLTWRNTYPPGTERLNGVTVRRFEVDYERPVEAFGRFAERLIGAPETRNYFEQVRWMALQGPYSSALFDYLSWSRERYDLFIFIPYLYCTTYLGLQRVPGRAVLFPMAHDEPWIYLDLFNALFHLPRGLIYNSVEERDFVHRRFGNDYLPHRVLGVGIDVPRIPGPGVPHGEYIVYVGRVDPGKGCDTLIEYFLRYKAAHPGPLELLLIGKVTMPLPDRPDIRPLGFMKDERFPWMQAARALILPSAYESLSLVTLESWALGTPVLVNARAEVVRGHCRRSNGGLYYSDYDEFAAALNLLLTNEPLRRTLARNGADYVVREYSWETVEQGYLEWLGELHARLAHGRGNGAAKEEYV
jgi:glycosyltransferase involved in cell wall biosynthesis